MLNYRSLNSATIVGRVGSTKVVEGKVKFISLSVATESLRKNTEGKYESATEWHDVVYFAPQGSIDKLATALVKGAYVAVTGSLSTKKTDKGRFTSIVADSVQLIGGGAKKDEKPAAKPAPAGTAEDDCPF